MARQIKLSPERKEFIQQLLGAYKPEDGNYNGSLVKTTFKNFKHAFKQHISPP